MLNKEGNIKHLTRSEIEIKYLIDDVNVSQMVQKLKELDKHPIRRYFANFNKAVEIMEYKVDRYHKICELLSGNVFEFYFSITKWGSAHAGISYDIGYPDGRMEAGKFIGINNYEVNAKYKKITIVFDNDETKVILPAKYFDTYHYEKDVCVAVEHWAEHDEFKFLINDKNALRCAGEHFLHSIRRYEPNKDTKIK